MRRRTSSQSGMTLIELLIAVTIFGAISASMGIVLNIAFTSMNKIDSKVDFNRRILSSQRTLDHILQGVIPINAPCAGLPVGIVGRQNAVRFVSSHSLTEGSRGRPQIVELFPDPSPNGGMRLLLNEQPFVGKFSLSSACAQPFIVRPTSFILADKLANVAFSFRKRDHSMPGELWLSGWSFPEWPSGIKIEMAPLKPIPGQIQPTTVFAPILIMNYNTDDASLQP
ncbi:MAG: type II secretion system protein [Acidobacteria bacterium]|nr:type II secretion system protein [Acidobacteriota bacterium]